MASPTLVDDSNPAVQYEPGWIWQQLVNEVDHTRHGAAITGLNASLAFYGSGVQVVGTLEPSGTSGQPTTAYTIDGQKVDTYNAPFTAAGDVTFNVTFFSKLDLPLDNHEIVITNENGASPNTFWLDYFLIYTQTASSGGATPTSTSTSVTPLTTPTNTVVSTTLSTSITSTATSSSASVIALIPTSSSSTASSVSSSSSSSSSTPTDSTTHSFSGTLSQSNTSSVTSSATVLPASGTAQSSAHSNIGKIVGGVVGGVAFLVLLALLFVCLRRRRRAQDDIEPFTPQTRERSSFSGTLLGGGSPAVKVTKIPELSLASSTAATSSPTSRSYSAPASSAMSAQPSELGAPITAIGGVSVAAGSSNPSPISPPRGLSPSDLKLQESLYGPSSAAARSTPRLGQSPLSPLGSVGASEYAPSLATTRMPADTEASRARWYAPAQEHEQSRAQSLLSLLSSRGRRRRDQEAQHQAQDQDSGLRLYNEPMLPPPYTAD